MINDLMESIPSTNVKVIELYNKIEAETLVLSPDFQRKLVWKKQHKFQFIETILKNYPFPEVYIASSEMDVAKITSKEIVVDGQQRLSTIVDYIKGSGDFKNQSRIKSFGELTTQEKKLFLNYFVSVRDLKNMEIDTIKDIFMRINNTEYSLNAVEKINAQYGDSEFIIFCKQLIDETYNPTRVETDSIVEPRIRRIALDFFAKGHIFSDYDVKRMGNLQFVMTYVSTIIASDYFNRNQQVADYIELYNEDFSKQQFVEEKLHNAICIFNKLKLKKDSYWYSKSNSFTLLVELSKASMDKLDLELLNEKLDEVDFKNKKYFADIDVETISTSMIKYFDFAKEGVNRKIARNYRGQYVKELLGECAV